MKFLEWQSELLQLSNKDEVDTYNHYEALKTIWAMGYTPEDGLEGYRKFKNRYEELKKNNVHPGAFSL